MTRGNIYVCDTFLAEIPSDAYPGGDTWKLLEALDGCTQREFETRVTEFIGGWDATRLASNGCTGVGNWDYDFCWTPVSPPQLPSGRGENYHDWDNWTGNVLVREVSPLWVDRDGNCGYWQIPGPWQPIGEFHSQWKLRKPLDRDHAMMRMDTDGRLTAVVPIDLEELIACHEVNTTLALRLTNFAHPITILDHRVVGHEGPRTVLVEVSVDLGTWLADHPPS